MFSVSRVDRQGHQLKSEPLSFCRSLPCFCLQCAFTASSIARKQLPLRSRILQEYRSLQLFRSPAVSSIEGSSSLSSGKDVHRQEYANQRAEKTKALSEVRRDEPTDCLRTEATEHRSLSGLSTELKTCSGTIVKFIAFGLLLCIVDIALGLCVLSAGCVCVSLDLFGIRSSKPTEHGWRTKVLAWIRGCFQRRLKFPGHKSKKS